MLDITLWIVGIIVFLLALAVSVGLHEAGHMVTAKLLKLKVPNFSIGFGKKLFKYKTKNTEYSLSLLPLGGYVNIQDERYEPKSYESASLAHVHPFKRILVFVAGPVVNLILGITLIIGSIMTIPYDKPTTTIDMVNNCAGAQQLYGAPICGAAEAGVTAGEKVVAIDGKEVNDLEEIRELINGKETVTLTTVKNEASTDTKTYENVEVVNNQLGLSVTTEEAYRNVFQAATFIEGIVKQSIQAITKIPETAPSVVTSIATGERDPEAPGSVVSVGKAYGEISTSEEPPKEKATNYLLLTGLFNLSLGILNLLPILPLDGGRMLIAASDWFMMGFRKITKKEYKPLGRKAFTVLSVASATVVIGFMALLILSDVSLLIRGVL